MHVLKDDSKLAGKMEALREILTRAEKVAIAFSGGVDSTFLLAVASETLGPTNVLAATATGPVYTQRERSFAEEFASKLGVAQVLIPTWDLAKKHNGAYVNAPDRCYWCKTELFEEVLKVAGDRGFSTVADGTNHSDAGDYRPGLRALKELSIRSPLLEAGLEKQDVRALSKEMGLPTWDRPAMACLSSRFPYGAAITEPALSQVERAEEHLMDMGYRQVRVRHHGELARIEVSPAEVSRLVADAESIVGALKDIGFSYVTMDLQGYRMGSMNETLSPQEIKQENSE